MRLFFIAATRSWLYVVRIRVLSCIFTTTMSLLYTEGTEMTKVRLSSSAMKSMKTNRLGIFCRALSWLSQRHNSANFFGLHSLARKLKQVIYWKFSTHSILQKKARKSRLYGLFLAPRVGLEPTTLRLTAACSTDWANEEYRGLAKNAYTLFV